jgi:hypothetical protein
VTRLPRRRALVGAAALAAAASLPAAVLAQDPRLNDAQAAARKRFQDAIPADKWGDALAAVRGPLGKVEQRSLAGSRLADQFEGLPKGEYAQLTFRTAWTARPDGREHVSLERVGGAWKVIGYVVQ